MRLTFHWLLLLGLSFNGYAQTNVIYGNVGNYGLVPQPRVNVTVTLISPNPRTVGDFVIRQDPISTLSSSNGYFAFTNLLWGDYTYTVAGVRGTTFKLQVQTNSNGTIPIGALTPPSEAYLPDPATNYYTMAQVDSLLAGVTGGTSGTTNTFRVLNVKELGAVGDGTTDDSAAIQRAINLASTNDLALADLYYPPGKYKVATSLIIPSNCPTTVLKASTGPLRMFGAGSSSSIILSYVTEGATLDATCPGNYANNMGLKLERMGITGPAVRDVTQTGHSIGLNLGWHDDTSAGQNQYRGDSIMLQDVAIDGFYMAITSTNVWGLTVDNCMFQSNQVAALALSKTHSAIIRNTSIRGVDLAGRFTGTAIGFYAPRGSDTSWGFGDTALLMGVRTYFCTNAIYNDELQLTDIGGNYQFSHTYYTIRSGMRTNAVMQKWHPWATLNGVVFCDSTTGYHNGGNATARCETDSAAAPFITLINYMGDVCVPGNRTDWNVLGATPSDGNVDSTSGYWTFGTANAAQPQVIGGKNVNATLNSGATFTFYTVSNLMAVATAGMVTNNAGGLTLSGTWSGNVSLVDGASEASISREGDTTAFLDFTLGDYSARQTPTNWQFYLPLVGNASGLTNFTFDTLQTFNDITNTGSIYNSGSIIGFGGLNIRGGNVIATNGTTTLGNVTASGTFTGNGSGLTNIPTGSYIIAATNSPAAWRAQATAVCDGSTDWQAISNAVRTSQAVVFAPGDYTLTNGIWWTGLSNRTLTGYGAFIALQTNQFPSGVSAFRFAQCTNLSVTGLAMNGNTRTRTNNLTVVTFSGLDIDRSENVTIDNCDIWNWTSGINITSCNRVRVDRCRLHEGYGNSHFFNCDGVGGVPNRDISLSGSWIYDIGSGANKVEQTTGFTMLGCTVRPYAGTNANEFVFGPNDVPPDTTNDNFVVVGNIFYGGAFFSITDTNFGMVFANNILRGGAGLVIGDGQYPMNPRSVSILGNHIADATSYGINGGVNVFGRWLVQGNVIENCGAGIGIFDTNAVALVIQNNWVLNCTSPTAEGIRVKSKAVIQGNKVEFAAASSQHGISMGQPTTSNSVVTANTVMRAGIGIYFAGTNHNISGNTMLECTVGGQQAGSSGTRYVNNIVPTGTYLNSGAVPNAADQFIFRPDSDVWIVGADGNGNVRTDNVEHDFNLAVPHKNFLTNKPVTALLAQVGSGGGNILNIGSGRSSSYGVFQRVNLFAGSSSTTVSDGYPIFSARATSTVGGTLNVGSDNTGTSGLFVDTSFGGKFTLTTSNLTLNSSNYIVGVNTTGGAVTITLPTAASIAGRIYTVKDIGYGAGTNNITIATTSSQTVDGAAPAAIAAAKGCRTFISDGANWQILWQYP